MKINLDNQFIEDAIGDLIEVLGVRGPVPVSTNVYLQHQSSVRLCVERIAQQMGLPIRPKLSYPHGIPTQSVSWCDTSIAAQVLVPGSLPLYGSSAMNGFEIEIQVDRQLLDRPAAFCSVMVHELAHVLLSALRHPKAHDEVYADLACLVLGFYGVMNEGKSITEEGQSGGLTRFTEYGYLTQRQFKYAAEVVSRRLNQYREPKIRLTNMVTAVRNACKRTTACLSLFQEALKHLDSDLLRPTNPGDATRLVALHASGRTEPIRETVRDCQKLVEEANRTVNQLWCYSPKTASILQPLESGLRSVKRRLDDQHQHLSRDTLVLLRNLSSTSRRRLTSDADGWQYVQATDEPTAHRTTTPRVGKKMTGGAKSLRTYGGIGRFGYSAAFLALAVAWLLSGVLGILYHFPHEALLTIAFFLSAVWVAITVARLGNTGLGWWWAGLLFVPLLNVMIFVRCTMCPEGFQQTKRLDRDGKVIAGVYVTLIVLGLILAGRLHLGRT